MNNFKVGFEATIQANIRHFGKFDSENQMPIIEIRSALDYVRMRLEVMVSINTFHEGTVSFGRRSTPPMR